MEQLHEESQAFRSDFVIQNYTLGLLAYLLRRCLGWVPGGSNYLLRMWARSLREKCLGVFTSETMTFRSSDSNCGA